jgi:hypothetical protein
LRDIVKALHAATDRGIKAADKDPAIAQKTLADCEEILEVIMAGRVKEWIAA